MNKSKEASINQAMVALTQWYEYRGISYQLPVVLFDSRSLISPIWWFYLQDLRAWKVEIVSCELSSMHKSNRRILSTYENRRPKEEIRSERSLEIWWSST